jgi:trimeric autotransporter adhesin
MIYFLVACFLLRVAISLNVNSVQKLAGACGLDGSNSGCFYSPMGIAVDSTSNLYIADSGNFRIRKVSNASVFSTVVGLGQPGNVYSNNPLNALLQFPMGLALTNQGMYVCDTGNSRVLFLNASNNQLSIFAGSASPGYYGDNGPATSAGLSTPSSVVVDNVGSVYIADTSNNVVRRVNISTGIITTFVGNGVTGFGGDNGPASSAMLNQPFGLAFSPDFATLYVSDTGNSRVRKVTFSNSYIYAVSGAATPGFNGDGIAASSAQLWNPRGIATDASGSIFIADSTNNRIRKITAGVISTVAGSSLPGFSGDGSAATSAQLYGPSNVFTMADGSFYFSDTNNFRVRKVASNGIISTVAGSGMFGFSGDGGPSSSSQVSNVIGLSIDSSYNLWMGDCSNNRIRQIIYSTGIITSIAGNGVGNSSGNGGLAINASTFAPCGLVLDRYGNLIESEFDSNVVRKITALSPFLPPYWSNINVVAGVNNVAGFNDNVPAQSALLNGPFGLIYDPFGNLLIADCNNNRIRRVNSITGNISTIVGTGIASYSGNGGPAIYASINCPGGLAFDSNGNLLFADSGNNVIRRVDAVTGVISTVAGTSAMGFSDNMAATSAMLNSPTWVALDIYNNMYIADTNNNAIRFVNSSGIISTIFRQAQINTVALDNLGNLYFSGNNGVYLMKNQTIPAPSAYPSSSVSSTPIVIPSFPSNNNGTSSNNVNPVASIIGGIIGGLLILSGIFGLIVLYMRRRTRQKPLTTVQVTSFSSKRNTNTTSARRVSTTEERRSSYV